MILTIDNNKLPLNNEKASQVFFDLNFFKNLTLEQNANLVYFYNVIEEFEYYKFSRNFILKDFKNYKRTRFSIKLWNDYKFILTESLLLNFNNLENKIFFYLIFNLKRKFFLNKWGRLKLIKNYFSSPIKYNIIHFYKFLYNLNFLAIFKRRKTPDKRLINYNFYLYKFTVDNTLIIFFPIFELKKENFCKPDVKPKKNPSRLLRSIPKSKINKAILKKYFLNSILSKEKFNLSISTDKLNLLHKNIFINYTGDKNFKVLEKLIPELLFYFWNKIKLFENNIIVKYLIIIILQYFNFKRINNLFTIIFLSLISGNKITYQSLTDKMVFFTSYTNFPVFFIKKYKSKERFTRVHINRTILIRKIFKFYQGFYKINNLNGDFYDLSKNLFKVIEVKKSLSVTIKKNFYPKKIYKKKTLFWSKITTFFTSKRLINANIGEHFSQFSTYLEKTLKLLYFSVLTSYLPKYYYNDNKLSFSLSMPTNFSLFFNKYIKLDIKSSFLSRIFFYNYSVYNLNLFFKKIFISLYSKQLNYRLYLNNFEVYFFRKNLVYSIINKEIALYSMTYWIFNTTLGIIDKKLFKWIRKWLEKKLVIDDLAFYQEMEHLLFEYNYTLLEWSREFVRIKQLAEIWLNKLTDYLMKMWKLKKEVGNIQYSPDFTQQHEFALTLKWGIELEMMRYTRNIILWRFYGKNKYVVRSNFIRKKINFLYNLTTSKYKKKKSAEFALYNTNIDKVLSLKSIYELTRIQIATSIAIYKNIYKLRGMQLDYFHIHFWINNESTVKNFYNFFFFVFERYFLVESYKKYYWVTKIKKKISFPKMISKKVFNRFVLRIRFHRILIFLKHSFNYYFIWIFRNLKKNIHKNIKIDYFYNLVNLLIFRFSRSFLLPSEKTVMDYRIFNLEIQDLNVNISNKFKFFSKKKILNFDLLDFLNLNTNFFLFFKPELYNGVIILNIFKNKLNLNVKSNTEDFFQKIKKNSCQNYCNSIFNSKLTKFFINLLSEFFYEIFIKFVQTTKTINKFNNLNKFKSNNIYSNITSSCFSFSFFYMLDQSNTILNKKFQNFKIWGFLMELGNFLKNKKNFKKLILFLQTSFLKNISLQCLLLKHTPNIEYNYLNYNFISCIHEMLMNNIFSENFLTLITNAFIFRFLDFLKADTSNFIIKKFHFETFLLWNFIKQIEILLTDFLFEFSNYLLQNK